MDNGLIKFAKLVSALIADNYNVIESNYYMYKDNVIVDLIFYKDDTKIRVFNDGEYEIQYTDDIESVIQLIHAAIQ